MHRQYHQGQKINCRGEQWQVTKALPHNAKTSNGLDKIVWELETIGLSGLVKGEKFIFLDDIDEIEVINPAEVSPVLDTSPKVRRTRTYLEAHLRKLLPRNGALYLGEHGAYEKELEYQQEPAHKALNLLRPRILIGDAVGLGKTIECGILLSELIRRGKARRVLCAVPKAVLEQFQMEMWGRFSIPFHRLDSKGLERLRQDIPSTMNPFYHYDKCIISVDTLKLKKYQKLLENCNWDVLIIDECHNVADRTDGQGGSDRHKVAKRLADKSRAVVLMSATPHDGTKYGFASLIKLLDRTLIPSDQEYTANDIKKVFIRRTRASLKGAGINQHPRKEILQKVELNKKEVALLQEIHDLDLTTDKFSKKRNGAKELFKTTLIKSFLSSPAALSETVGKKIKQLERKLNKENTSEDTDDYKAINALQNIKVNSDKVTPSFTRLKHLIDFLNKEPATETNKIVIFTERIKTMEWLSENLIKQGLAKNYFIPKEDKQKTGSLLATASGGHSDIDLNKVVKAFQSKSSKVNVLVTTNVASEGLNLHANCHRLIHFDLPWSLITLEQRNGRIDRLGQEKQPHIYYFASEALAANREAPDLKKLKDDFWIVDKIEQRKNQAAVDMDEDAIKKFSTGTEEENENTMRYQDGQISKNQADQPMTDLEDLFNSMSAEATNVKKRPLATLFESSPDEFVENLAKEANIEINNLENTKLSLKLDKKINYEITTHWPKEFRPDENKLTFEIDRLKMAKHYKARLNSLAPLDKTYMNEIHPMIGLLEHTALGLFQGSEVPVINIEGAPGSIYFLMQGTLYNKLNEPVFQGWELVSFDENSKTCDKIVDLTEPDQTHEITKWVAEALSTNKQGVEPSPFFIKRIQNLTAKALKWMSDHVLDARTKRGESKKENLKNEIKRIKAWETTRYEYLNQITKQKQSASHRGHFSVAKKASEELETLKKDSKALTEFIQKSLATESTPDISILAIFTTEGY